MRCLVSRWQEEPTEDLVLGWIEVLDVTCQVCIVQCCDRSEMLHRGKRLTEAHVRRITKVVVLH